MPDQSEKHKPSDALTQNRLRELVHYDPETGIFTAKVARSNVHVGQRLGSPHHSGYLLTMILGKRYALHRLAFLYMTGRWPSEVDHRNRKRSDTRWANLREATRSQNRVNSHVVAASGFRGVSRLRPTASGDPRYLAQLKVRGVRMYLGVFQTPEAAHAAYVRAAQAAYGEFAEHLT